LSQAIKIEDRSGVSIVHVEGALTPIEDDTLVSTVRRLLGKDRAQVILDLKDVTFMNSNGIGDLVRITAQANSQGGRVVMANASPFVSGVFSTTKLDQFFEVCGDIETALDRLS